MNTQKSFVITSMAAAVLMLASCNKEELCFNPQDISNETCLNDVATTEEGAIVRGSDTIAYQQSTISYTYDIVKEAPATDGIIRFTSSCGNAATFCGRVWNTDNPTVYEIDGYAIDEAGNVIDIDMGLITSILNQIL